jgi:hypothetical protein
MVDIAVTPVNDAPVLTAGVVAPLSLLEDAPLAPFGLQDIAYSPGGASDEAGQTLTYSVTAVPASTLGDVLLADGSTSVTPDTYSLAEIRGMQFRPAPDAYGSAVFTFRVQDDGGTAGGGADLLDQSVAINVSPVNDAPSFVRGDHQMLSEDAGPQTLSGWATAISAGPANESGQTIGFQITTTGDSLFSSLPAVDPATGTLTFTPAPNAFGVATVSVSLQDDGGTGNGGADTSPVQSFVIVLSSVNDLPTVSTIADQNTSEDTPLGPLGFTVSDVETAAADLLVTAVSSNPAVVPSSSVALAGTGSTRTVTVTPAANQYGSTTITLTVTDSLGESQTTSFSVTVNSVNDLPLVSQIPNTCVEQNTASRTFSFTLSDVETGAGSLELESSSSNTQLVPLEDIEFGGTGSARTLTVRPAANQAGTAVITVTVEDAQ